MPKIAAVLLVTRDGTETIERSTPNPFVAPFIATRNIETGIITTATDIETGEIYTFGPGILEVDTSPL